VSAAAHLVERQARTMQERHEDVEDLLNFGASIAEVIERSGYKGWAGLRTSLQRAGRDDLLEKLKVKLVDAELPKQRRKREPRPKCEANHLCPNRPIDGLCLFHWGVRWTRCTEDDCLNPRNTRGLCMTHYNQLRWAESKEEAA